MVREVRAAVTLEPMKMAPMRLPYPEEVEEGDFIARLRMCGICGTDHHIWAGHMPDLPWPILQGHEIVGEVHEIGEATAERIEAHGRPLAVGDRVIWGGATPCGECWYCRWLPQNYRGGLCENRPTYSLGGVTDVAGGFSDYNYAQRKVPYRIPDDIPDRVAVLTDTLASVWGIDRALGGMPAANEGLFWGWKAAVQGSGPIGICAAMKLREYGVDELIMVGGPEWRLREAEKFGVDHTINIEEVTDPEARLAEVRRLTGGRGPDIVVECAGVPAAFPEGIRMVRRGGILVEIGHYTDAGSVMVNPHLVCYKDLTLISQYGFSFHQYDTALRQLIKWHRDGEYPLEDLVTHEFRIEETEKGIKLHRQWKTLKAIVVP
ncbi:MAG: zinc-binding dehydrogenase [Candidatus Bathyarchaeia archaeon]